VRNRFPHRLEVPALCTVYYRRRQQPVVIEGPHRCHLAPAVGCSIVVGKKAIGKRAVTRNLARRRLKAALRQEILPWLCGDIDFVIYAQAGCSFIKMTEMERLLREAFRKKGLLVGNGDNRYVFSDAVLQEALRSYSQKHVRSKSSGEYKQWHTAPKEDAWQPTPQMK